MAEKRKRKDIRALRSQPKRKATDGTRTEELGSDGQEENGSDGKSQIVMESDEESEMFSEDSEAEAMFLEEGDSTDEECYSDFDWDPDSKEPQVDDSSSSEEEPLPPTPKRGSVSRSPRGKGRGRIRRSSSSQSLSSNSTSEERWNDVDVPDITPPQPTFRPARTAGPQLLLTETYSALQLFQLFFTNSILLNIVQNTNEFGAKFHSPPNTPWVDITLQDMFSFMAMVIYMGVVKCSSHTDYWRGGNLYSLLFPKRVMAGKKFLRICQSLHLSSSVADAANEQKRGTADFDRLGEIKPLYDEIKAACRTHFHPSQDISIDERMVASKARIGFKQYMKNKPVRWGYKLFVLADSNTGYTWDFFIYQGKTHRTTGKGLSYESVMDLIDTRLLGTGYKLFVDNFYTSPALFRDLLKQKVWACGTIRSHRIGFPKTRINALDSKSPRGSIRWIRKDSLLFVQWRDTRDVSLCSALHTAHSDATVERRLKGEDGRWALKTVQVPPAVKEYNQCMGGVDLSDALIGYYKVLHKTQNWYKTFFYHFMDIAIVNAFLFHKDIARRKGETPLHQKSFRETLAEELAAVGSTSKARPAAPPAPPALAHHRLVHISGSSTTGRLKCRHCHAKTPVKCSTCDVPLCFVPARDCYNEWHVAKDL